MATKIRHNCRLSSYFKEGIGAGACLVWIASTEPAVPEVRGNASASISIANIAQMYFWPGSKKLQGLQGAPDHYEAYLQ